MLSFFLSVNEVVNTIETHTHCIVSGSNPGEGVQPNNFNIVSWARLHRLMLGFIICTKLHS